MLTVREKRLKSAHCKELQSNIPINNYFGTPLGEERLVLPLAPYLWRCYYADIQNR